jgi:hypothetical protein
MRRLVVLGALGLVACGFDVTGPPPGQVIRDDTAADFMASGSTLDGVEIADAGLITPLGWVTGAALAKGANSELFQDPTTVDWGTLDANTPAGTAFAAPIGDYGNGAPSGVGLAQTDDFTVWIAGEIWLEAGTHTFQLSADDNGLLDLAPEGGAFTRVVTAQWFQGAQMGTYTAGADGWYAIHMAMSEGNGQASYVLEHQPPGAAALAPLDPDRLRAPVASARGVVADAFDDFYLVRPVGRSLLAAPLLDQQYGTTVPSDTGITASTLYSFHWAAQVRVDVGGDYAFQLDTDDGQRLRVDGALVLDAFTNISEKNTTSPIQLDPGWHDFVIDYTQYAASAHATLHVASGPDLAGGPFPLDRVRPIVPRADRVGGDSSATQLQLPQGGTVTYTLAPPVPAGATVDGVDVEYTTSVQHTRDLQISVIGPDGSRAIVRPHNDVDHTGASIERRTTHGLDGKPAAGPWQLEFVDASGNDNGNVRDGALTVHYTGGRAPLAPAASYDSQVHDLGATATIDEVTYGASAPPGAGVAVRLRTGDTAEGLMAQPWSDPIVSGAPPIVAPGRFVQYRVELTSDGDHSAAFDWIELVYRATS